MLSAWIYGLIAASAVFGTAGFVYMMLQFFLLVRKRLSAPILPCVSTKTTDVLTLKKAGRVFTFEEIEECCEGFSNLIGETQYHYIYKGTLPNGTEVAVKTTKECAAKHPSIEKNFYMQVDLLSQIRHRHVANLIGFCTEKHHRMLIFEYAPNGALFNNLHDGDDPLSWKLRMGVAVGTANALAYLHQFRGYPIVHGDLTSHNVLLAEDFSAKVCGIGIPSHCSKEVLPKVNGVIDGPDLHENGGKCTSSDVYSFGVLLLELISGKSVSSKETDTIVEWAGQFLRSRDQMSLLVDPMLKSVVPLELYSVCEIARLCIQREEASRPSMEHVQYMLVESLGINPESSASNSSHAE